MKPRPYQEKVLEQLSEGGNTGLMAMGLGTGKTPSACWVAQNAGAKNILIVGPIRTEAGWEKHSRLILGQPLRVINSKKAGKANLAALLNKEQGVYFIGWEYMRSINSEKRFDGRAKKNKLKSIQHPFNGIEFDLLIADEWHRASNQTSLNYQVVSRIKAKHRLALSATPAGNKPSRIWAALNFLWPQRWGGYWKFAEKFFVKESNPFSDLGYTFGEEKRPGTVRRGAPCWVEVTAKDANPDMPEVVVERVKVPLTREQRHTYDEWANEALAWLDDNPVAIALPPTLDLRLRQVTLGQVSSRESQRLNKYGEMEDYYEIYFDKDCKSAKIDALLDILSDLPEGEPVVVWVHSQKFMTPLIHRLTKAGYKAVEVSGKSKGDYRDLINGKAQILCAQHEACAEGVDGLQDVCHVEVWLSQSNSVIINEQATGRLHRTGQTQAVIRYLIQAENTIDDKVFGRLQDSYDKLKESGLI